jgi:hypothetical protein
MARAVQSYRLLVAGSLVLLASFGLAIALTGGDPASAEEPALRSREQASAAKLDEHTMFGGSPARNMVNLTGRISAAVLGKVNEEGKFVASDAAAIKWHADLGSRAYGGPIVAGGKVFVGTNNELPRNPRDAVKNADGEIEPIDKGIVMCFDESTGKFLWQAVHDKLPGGQVVDWPKEGVCSTPVVDGNRVYYVSNQCKVVCADANGLSDGNQGIATEKYQTPTDADFVWELDMIGDLGVFPHNMAACSPLHRRGQEFWKGSMETTRPRSEDHARPVVEPRVCRNQWSPAGHLSRRGWLALWSQTGNR